MDLTTLAMAGTVLSAGKILYEVGSAVGDMFSDDEQVELADAPAPSVLSGLTPEGVNNAVEGSETGAVIDFKA
ncbi:hypothetical protein [Seleniivibrio woodruffii]|uniref:hypothetical protein n=1 Tax=Seleniivibrio woodruffii TaxID=1078050 RepID=UPI0026ED6780|nr:hypothetical protein [Seleniivibrio woodruffii]